MSAPVLSPAEQAEVDRFGIHDADVIADLERNRDDVPRCSAGDSRGACGAPATHSVSCTQCGGFTGLVCAPHAARARTSTRPVTHRACGAVGPVCEIARVMPL